MVAVSKNICFHVLDYMVNGYNNTIHSTLKMNPIEYNAECNEDSNKKDPKFKVFDHVRISKYKNISTKGCIWYWSKEVFVAKKIKNTVPWSFFINNLIGGEIAGSFYEKELRKTNNEEFRIVKVVRRNWNKLFAKWKGYDSYFISWIDKKDIV